LWKKIIDVSESELSVMTHLVCLRLATKRRIREEREEKNKRREEKRRE